MNAYTYRTAVAFGTIMMIFAIVLMVVSVVAMWKIFEKAGKPGWAAVVPIYNLYVLYEISWGNGIYFGSLSNGVGKF